MRPRDADPGIDVVKSRVEVRVSIRAEAAARGEIERDGLVVERMQRVEYVVADTRVDRQVGSDFPLAICIEPIHIPALTHEREKRTVGGHADLIVQEVPSRGKCYSAAVRGSLVEEQALDFEAKFERVARFRPRHTVNETDGLRRIVGRGPSVQQ
jgi:hypothetical protein